MKKTPKKVLGCFGLVLVATMTIFAAFLPYPEALAVSSVTDTIVVRVLAGSPDVNINSPASGSIFVNPNQTVTFDYSKATDVLVTMEKEMPSGTPQVYTLFSGHPDQEPGNGSVNLDLSEAIYGYGEYTAIIRGDNGNGLVDEDSVKFSYVPVSAKVEEDENGKVDVILDYNEDSEDLDHFVINVYDDHGNIVSALSNITVEKPNKIVELPFAENKIPAGTYTIKVAAYDVNGELIYKTFDVVFVYDPTKVPNTGGFFKSLNISKEDYLATGLIIFFTAGITGIVFIAKNKRTSRK